jgi:hypothetical protein
MITLVYAYFENGSMLDRHLVEWNQYVNKDHYRAIIVDDCSKRDPAIDHLKDKEHPFSIELFRINTDIPWNQNGARNLAMTHAQGWCLITDMDHLLSVGNAQKLLDQTLDPKKAYRPTRIKAVNELPYKSHPNSYILTQSLYWKAGGYDEAFCGYYGSDSTFRSQLLKITERVDLEIPLILFSRSDIKDASTTDYGRHGSEYHISKNPDLRKRKNRNLEPIPPLNFEWEQLL